MKHCGEPERRLSLSEIGKGGEIMAQEEGKKGFTVIPDTIGGSKLGGLTYVGKGLLCRIISLSKDGPCTMSNIGFARRFGISTRQITSHIKTLCDKEMIEIERPSVRDRNIWPTQKGLELYNEWVKAVGKDDIKESIEETIQKEPSRRNLPSGRNLPEESRSEPRRNLRPKNTKNTSTKNTSICANADLRKRASSQQDETETMFSEFYQAYPKKRDKARARKSFFKIKNLPDVFPQLMKGLEQQKLSADWKKDGGKYVPYPSTWLNDERWEDELATQVQPPAQGPVHLTQADMERRDAEQQKQIDDATARYRQKKLAEMQKGAAK